MLAKNSGFMNKEEICVWLAWMQQRQSLVIHLEIFFPEVLLLKANIKFLVDKSKVTFQ